PPPPPPRGSRGQDGPGPRPGSGSGSPLGGPRSAIWVLAILAILGMFWVSQRPDDNGEELTYSEFMTKVRDDEVAEITYNNNNGTIDGKLVDDDEKFHTRGLLQFPDEDLSILEEHDVDLSTKTPSPGWLESWLPVI